MSFYFEKYTQETNDFSKQLALEPDTPENTTNRMAAVDFATDEEGGKKFSSNYKGLRKYVPEGEMNHFYSTTPFDLVKTR